MTWKTNIDHLSKKVSKRIEILRKAKDIITTESPRKLYQSLVQSHFDYCYFVWNNCSDELTDWLQKLQNKADRIITGDS